MSQHHTSEKTEKLLQEHNISGPQVREYAAKQFLNLSALAVREKAITLFLLITIVAAGIFAFLKLGRAEDPSFHDQGVYRFSGVARSDSTGDAGPCRRAAGEAHAGIAHLRSRRDLHPPRARADDGDSQGQLLAQRTSRKSFTRLVKS